MEKSIENLTNNKVEEKDVKISFFNEELVHIIGNPEKVKKIIEDILKMNEWNIKNFSKYVDKLFNGEWKDDLSGDILTPSGKMVRIYIRPPINNEVEVNIGGGGNSTPPEEMKKEIEKAIGLILKF